MGSFIGDENGKAKRVGVGFDVNATLLMPSNTRFDILTPVSANYVAPADGWFALEGTATAANQFVSLGNTQTRLYSTLHIPASGLAQRVMLPALKGTTISANFNTPAANTGLRFIYAEKTVIQDAASPRLLNVSMHATTGALTCTFSAEPTHKAVTALIGGTTIAGAWSGAGTTQVFTPAVAIEILETGWVIRAS